MRHRVAGKRLTRTTSHRRALRRNMAASLIQHGAIRTTEPKAKELRRFVERIITTAVKGTLHARRRVVSALGDRAMVGDDGVPLGQTVIQKLFDDIAPGFVDRQGGYTRIIRLDERRIGDAGEQVILQLVTESTSPAAGDDAREGSRRKRRAARRHQAAATSYQGQGEDQTEEGPADNEEAGQTREADEQTREESEQKPDAQQEAQEDK